MPVCDPGTNRTPSNNGFLGGGAGYSLLVMSGKRATQAYDYAPT